MKNYDRELENAARGRRPKLKAAFSSPRSQFFTLQTDPRPANNMFFFFSKLVLQITNGFAYATSSVKGL